MLRKIGKMTFKKIFSFLLLLSQNRSNFLLFCISETTKELVKKSVGKEREKEENLKPDDKYFE